MGSVLEIAQRPELGADQTAFNLAIWERLLADPLYAKIKTGHFGDGVKGIDIAKISFARLRQRGEKSIYTLTSEICVEVISSSNTPADFSSWFRKCRTTSRLINSCAP